jgi:hypothetical protein
MFTNAKTGWAWKPVLWIRIRKNPKVLPESESEKSLYSDMDSDPDTVEEWKILWKIADQTLERKKCILFYWTNFFSDVPVQIPEHIWKQSEAPFGKIWSQNKSLRIRIRKNEFGPTTLMKTGWLLPQWTQDERCNWCTGIEKQRLLARSFPSGKAPICGQSEFHFPKD